MSIFVGPGVSLGPSTPMGLQLNSAGVVSTQLAGTQVTFDGRPAPILYLSSSQINVVVPYEVSGEASTALQITGKGAQTNTVTLPVAASSPGVFAITNTDGSVNSLRRCGAGIRGGSFTGGGTDPRRGNRYRAINSPWGLPVRRPDSPSV